MRKFLSEFWLNSLYYAGLVILSVLLALLAALPVIAALLMWWLLGPVGFWQKVFTIGLDLFLLTGLFLTVPTAGAGLFMIWTKD